MKLRNWYLKAPFKFFLYASLAASLLGVLPGFVFYGGFVADSFGYALQGLGYAAGFMVCFILIPVGIVAAIGKRLARHKNVDYRLLQRWIWLPILPLAILVGFTAIGSMGSIYGVQKLSNEDIWGLALFFIGFFTAVYAFVSSLISLLIGATKLAKQVA